MSSHQCDLLSDPEVYGREILLHVMRGNFQNTGGKRLTDWLDAFGNLLSVEQNWKRITAAVGLMMFADLHRIIYQIIMKSYGSFVSVERV